MKTVRRRSGQTFVGLRASITRGDLDQQAQNVAEAYVQWESQPLTLSNGARMSGGYVLWLPESLLVQPSTDGLAKIFDVAHTVDSKTMSLQYLDARKSEETA